LPGLFLCVKRSIERRYLAGGWEVVAVRCEIRAYRWADLHACEGWKRVCKARACERVRLFASANDMRRLGDCKGYGILKEEGRGAQTWDAAPWPCCRWARVLVTPNGSVDDPEEYFYGVTPSLCEGDGRRGYPPCLCWKKARRLAPGRLSKREKRR